MKKKFACPYCRAPLSGKETQCPKCKNTLTPAIVPDPQKKKKALITLGIVFGTLLVLSVLLLWYFRVWPFRPKADGAIVSDAIGSPEAFPELTEIPKPSEEQTAALSAYVKKLEVQQKHRLDFTDRNGAKKIRILTAELSKEEPDLEKLVRELGGEITNPADQEEQSALPAGKALSYRLSPGLYGAPFYSAASVGRPVGTFLLSEDTDESPEGAEEGGQDADVFPEGAEGDVDVSPEGAESEEDADVIPEGAETEDPGSDEDLVVTLPPEQLHSSHLKIGTAKEKLKCPACGHENPKDAVQCEKCGTLLQSSPNYVVSEPIEPEPVIAGGGMSEEQRESLMLSNLSNVLLTANRSTLAFYMACLACEEDPQNVSAVVSLVTNLRMHGYLEEALDVCVIGLQMDPGREELYLHAGNIYIQKDNPSAALGYFGRCLERCGFSGPAYQGMMAAYLQQENYEEAFRCLIEGGRDGYTSGLSLVYDMLKRRGDYWEFAGAVFQNYTVRSLMDFSVNRSGFHPGRELEGKVVDIGACDIPSSPEDWVASAQPMIEGGQRYARDVITFYQEDLKELADIYNILLNAQDLKDLASGFMKIFGEKYKKEKLTEAERVVSYEQEVFWLNILDDYREWKVKDIREKVDKELDGSDMEQLFSMIGNILEENKAFLEAHDSESLEDIAAVLEWAMIRVEGNNSIAFTPEQSAVIVSKIKNALRQMGSVRNRAYQEIGEVLHDYYMYSNALLSMLADQELYREWRQKIVMNVVGDQAVCIAECCLLAYVCPMLAEPYLMVGKDTHEGFMEGGVTGRIPRFPKFIISNKPTRPSADLTQDVYIPDINSISRKVLGIDGPDSGAKNEYPELTNIWEIYWQDTHPGVPKSEMPDPPNFNDSYQREKFWNSLPPDKRALYQTILTNPDALKRTVQLDMYCGRGQTVVSFKEENVGLLNGLEGTAKPYGSNYSVTANANGTLQGNVRLGSIGKAEFDSNGNMKVTIKDKRGINLGIAKTGRDITTFVGASGGADLLPGGSEDDASQNGRPSGSVGGAGLKGGAQIYGTYSLAKGQVTSGGVKGGFGAALFGLIGAGAETNYNVVQGISTTSYYFILAGKKHSITYTSDLSYLKDSDRTEKKNVPGLQEFRR